MKNSVSKYKKGILFALGTVATLGVVSIVAASCAKPLINVNSINTYYKVPTSTESQAFHSLYKTMSNEGTRAFVLGGFMQPPALLSGLENNVFNKDSIALLVDIGFAENDETKAKLNNIKDKLSRVSSLVFNVEEAAFLAGIATAYQLNSNQERFLKDNKGLTWGGYVGINLSSTTPFLAGFSAGVKWANEKLKDKDIKQENSQTTKKYVEVKEQQLVQNSSAVGGFDAGMGDKVVNEFIDLDVDVLLVVAGGGQSRDAVQRVNSSSKDIMIVGVDVPQENDPLTNVKFGNKEAPIHFSIVKNMDTIVARTLKKATEQPQPFVGNYSEFKKEDEYKLGVHTAAGIDSGAVGISEPGHKYLIAATNLATNQQLVNYSDVVNYFLNKDDVYKQFLANDNLEYVASKGVDKDQKTAQTEKWTHPRAKSFYLSTASSDAFKKAYELADQKDKEADQNKYPKDYYKKLLVAQILSFPGDILADGAFNEKIFNGIVKFYEQVGITIPKPNQK